MNWQDVCNKSELQDLPYKIELNELGQIVMSPASNEHSFRQSRLIRELLKRSSDGEVIPECSIDTSDGVKVADVVWFSTAFHAEHGLSTPFPSAPELCIEVVSPSNTDLEMRRKRDLYFSQGAREVWICTVDGDIEFFGADGLLRDSEIFPGFTSGV